MKNSLFEAIGKLSKHDHICLIYETRSEQFDAVVPFIRIGLENGEKCVYVADENTADEVLSIMRCRGIDIESALDTGSLVIARKKETYLRQGYFDPDEMIRFLKESTDSAKKEGFSALRVAGEMTWVLGGEEGTSKNIEYEAKLNLFFPENDCLAICQYNKKRFSPELLADVIHTHPIVIVGNVVFRNFYYVPPGEFLKIDKRSFEVERLLSNLLDRECAQEATKESQEKFRQIVETANEGILMMDQDRKITFVNKKFEEMLGYTEQEIIERKLDEFVVPEEIDDHMKEMKKRWEGRTTQYERRFRRKDNEIICCSVSATPQFNTGKQFMGSFGMFLDITRQKHAEETIRKMNAELEQRVKERTAELENKNKDLETMIKGFVGRELRMIELKNTIEDLEKKLGERHGK